MIPAANLNSLRRGGPPPVGAEASLATAEGSSSGVARQAEAQREASVNMNLSGTSSF